MLHYIVAYLSGVDDSTMMVLGRQKNVHLQCIQIPKEHLEKVLHILETQTTTSFSTNKSSLSSRLLVSVFDINVTHVGGGGGGREMTPSPSAQARAVLIRWSTKTYENTTCTNLTGII